MAEPCTFPAAGFCREMIPTNRTALVAAGAAGAIAVLAVGVTAFVGLGIYDIGADDQENQGQRAHDYPERLANVSHNFLTQRLDSRPQVGIAK